MPMAKNFFEESENASAESSESNTTAVPPKPSPGYAGSVYDWQSASDVIKAPPREDMDGKVVTIKKAEIKFPRDDIEWSRTRDGSKEYKYCQFNLYYDYKGQIENYSGIRVFKNVNGMSEPSITRDGISQASALFVLVAKFKDIDVNELGMHTFMAFLNGLPKARIQRTEILNPSTKEKMFKNLVVEFVQ
jgi:hypothetical protein